VKIVGGVRSVDGGLIGVIEGFLKGKLEGMGIRENGKSFEEVLM
jgi:hypothetical protein